MDKARERWILDTVYDTSSMAGVLSGEEPDFLIQHHGIPEPFGVEVTEFYLSETNARLANVDGYSHDLIHHNRYRHKDDKRALHIGDFDIHSPDGELKGSARGVLVRGIEIAECIRRLTQLISTKEGKAACYLSRCRHVNLVVFDSEEFLRRTPIEGYFATLFRTELRELLFSTRFREVFLVSCIAGGRWVVVPMKMVLLLSEVVRFCEAISEPSADEFQSAEFRAHVATIENWRDTIPDIASYLSLKTRKLYHYVINDQPALVFGNTAIAFRNERLSLYDHADLPWPGTIRRVEPHTSTLLDLPEFRDRLQRLDELAAFSTELVYEPKRDISSDGRLPPRNCSSGSVEPPTSR